MRSFLFWREKLFLRESVFWQKNALPVLAEKRVFAVLAKNAFCGLVDNAFIGKCVFFIIFVSDKLILCLGL